MAKKIVIFIKDTTCGGRKTLDGDGVEINISKNTELPFGGPLDRTTKEGIFLATCGSIMFIPHHAIELRKSL
jgi:peptide methionine sulfoxide reductase MsrB